jgi:hypothetical protein
MAMQIPFPDKMTVINLATEVSAPIGRCFDVSRDIEVHQLSVK